MAPRVTPTDADVLARIDDEIGRSGARDPYARFAQFYGISNDDPRLYQMIGKIMAKGIEPNAWLDAKIGTGPEPKTKPVQPVDPRRMRGDQRRGENPIRGDEAPGYLPPTEDEMLGLDEGMAETGGLGTRAAVAAYGTITNPAKRREFERGLSDTITFGLAEKLAGKFGADMSPEQAAADVAEAGEGYRASGQIAGAFAPGGTRYLAQNAGNAISRVAGLGRGRLAGTAIGMLGGAASAPVVAGASEAAKGAVDVATGNGAAIEIPRRAWEAAKGTATDPMSMMLAAGLGGAGGYSRGLRGSNSQTGEDIRLREEFGGRPSLTRGAKGGAFEDPEIRAPRGTSAEVQALARSANDRVRGRLNQRDQANQAGYAQREGEFLASPRGQQLHDVTDALNTESAAIMGNSRIPLAVRETVTRKMASEVLDDPAFSGSWTREGRLMLTPQQINHLRQRWDAIAATGEAGEDAVTRGVAERLRTVDDATGYDRVKAPYAAEVERLKRGHELLGMGSRARTEADDLVTSKRGARVLRRQGENTATGGLEGQDFDEFVRLFPELREVAMSPQLLAAKGRMTPSLSGEGGTLYSRLKGLPERNLEPIEANVLYPLGQTAGQAAGLVPQLKNPILGAYEETKRRKARR